MTFQMWFLAQGGSVTAGHDMALLGKAVALSPSGNLYRDMNTFSSDVLSAKGAQGTSLGTGEKLMTLTAAEQVESDCGSVNPSS